MTPAQRKAAERERRRAAGLVRLEVYVRPEVRAEVRAYAEKRNREVAEVLGHHPNHGRAPIPDAPARDGA